MKSFYTFLFLLAFSISIGWAQASIETRSVHFATGTSSATEKGTLVGDQIIDYTLVAKAGQTMSVSLNTENTANYFNVLPPGSQTAIFIGSTLGNDYSGILPDDGKYTVRVYLMRSAARRNEKADFTISFSITAGKASPNDAMVSGTVYHAKGTVPCSVGPDPKGSAQCDFGVIRKGLGQAEVHVSIPGGDKRTLIFNGDQVKCADPGVSLQAVFKDYNWEISLDDFEYFSIPDAVVNGG